MDAAPLQRQAERLGDRRSSWTPCPSSCSGPGERAIPSSIAAQRALVDVPGARSAQYFHASVPLPSVVPFPPRSIGPAGT
jgi:hypothetical protein